MSSGMVRYVVLLCLAAAQCAHSGTSQVNTPEVGAARFSDGSVHRVLGVAGAFVIGDVSLRGATSASFSGGGGIVSLSDRILLIAPDSTVVAEWAIEQDSPVLSIGNELTSAVAWLDRGNSLVYWSGTSFQSVTEVQLPAGRVTSVQRAGDRVTLVIASGKDILSASVSLSSGALIDYRPLPGAQGFAYPLPAGLLTAGKHGLQLVDPSGQMRSLGILETDPVVERMGRDWLHISSHSDARHWALSLSGKEPELFELPAARGEK